MAKKTNEHGHGNGMPGGPMDPGSAKIKETVVADPSISFTLDFLPLGLQKSDEGYFLKHLTAKIFLNDIGNGNPDVFICVAKVHVKSLSDTSAYFYVPFGDPDYGAGKYFTFVLELSAVNAITGLPVMFNDSGNIFVQELVGGGILTNVSPDQHTHARIKQVQEQD